MKKGATLTERRFLRLAITHASHPLHQWLHPATRTRDLAFELEQYVLSVVLGDMLRFVAISSQAPEEVQHTLEE